MLLFVPSHSSGITQVRKINANYFTHHFRMPIKYHEGLPSKLKDVNDVVLVTYIVNFEHISHLLLVLLLLTLSR